jgi:hypothetical protein
VARRSWARSSATDRAQNAAAAVAGRPIAGPGRLVARYAARTLGPLDDGSGSWVLTAQVDPIVLGAVRARPVAGVRHDRCPRPWERWSAVKNEGGADRIARGGVWLDGGMSARKSTPVWFVRDPRRSRHARAAAEDVNDLATCVWSSLRR